MPHISQTVVVGVSINFRGLLLGLCSWGFDGPLSLLELDEFDLRLFDLRLDELELELEDLEFLMTALSLFNVGNSSEEVACL